MKRYPAGKAGEIPQGGRLQVELGGFGIGIFHLSDGFFALVSSQILAESWAKPARDRLTPTLEAVGIGTTKGWNWALAPVTRVTAIGCRFDIVRDEVLLPFFLFCEFYYEKEFTGISDPYDEPADAEVVIDTLNTSPEEAAQQIFLRLEKEGYIGPE